MTITAERKTEIYEIPIGLIDGFPGHPFKVRMDEDMQELVESIRENGLITPLILRRKEDGRYEVVSGHRRKMACEIAGMATVIAEVRDMTREEAIIVMVDSNLHRSRILPSEKAFAYKMKLEAMNKQGQRNDLTSDPVGPKLKTRSNEELSRIVGDSISQIKRFIRLAELSPRVLEKVDEGCIGLRPAVELSYLRPEEQEMLADIMELTESTPSHAQAIRLRSLSSEGALSPAAINMVLREQKPNQKEQIRVSYDRAVRYLPSGMPFSEAEDYILKALRFYQRYLEKDRDAR